MIGLQTIDVLLISLAFVFHQRQPNDSLCNRITRNYVSTLRSLSEKKTKYGTVLVKLIKCRFKLSGVLHICTVKKTLYGNFFLFGTLVVVKLHYFTSQRYQFQLEKNLK